MLPIMIVHYDSNAKRLHCRSNTKRMSLDAYLKWDCYPEIIMCAMIGRITERGGLSHARYTEMKNDPQAAQRLTRRLWRMLAPRLLPYILGETGG